MEGVIFCGIQASGKTTFYRERFFDTHVRISLDLLRTRRREQLLLAACLEGRQPFVVDNTNPTIADRARYIAPALAAGFEVIGYFFATEPRAAFERNRRRPGRAAVPAAGLFGTQKRLQVPTLEEGFRRVYRVGIAEGDEFQVDPWLPAEPLDE
jgi:predicted kinase